MLHITRSPATRLSDISRSGIPVYQLAGWYDVFVKDALLWFANLETPQKITIGPWWHTDQRRLNVLAEQLRWFDKWLKGIENGIMDEPPITYYTMGAPEGEKWRHAWKWPLPTQKPTKYYFSGSVSGSVGSANDGSLMTQLPHSAGQDEYRVDYTATSGSGSRWVNGYGGPFGYPDMTTNDLKSLTYTTAPLATDVEVTGHPVVHLWITSTHSDADIVAYIEEVDSQGISDYITEGTLRASHRAMASPPFNNLGLPYHRSFAEDILDLPDQPVELVFDMLPTSKLFRAGHRIRVAIAGADRDNLQTKEISPPPQLTVYRSGKHSSYITLPIIPPQSEAIDARVH